ncbi:MAG: FCD domain-containing protein [Gammaproteobacteria bacterium]
MNPSDPRPRDAAGHEDAATLAERVYRQIRADIVSGALAPGFRLRLEPLRERYDVGMSPLREALARLASDTFATAIENRGYRVAELSRADLDDITSARVVIERAALAQAIERGDEAWEAEIVATHYRLGKVDARLGADDSSLLDSWEQANRAFHDALVAACPSRWLQRFRALLQDQSKRYRRVSLLESASFRSVAAEHDALREATLARRLPLALDLVEAHIRATADLVRDKLPAGSDSTT